jgi:hypothetical protein
MNNANVIFGIPGVTQSVISGSLLDFKVQKQAEIKEATDINNNYFAVAKGKQKRVVNISVLLTTSGSSVAVPEILTPATISSTISGDVSGNYYVSGQPSVDWKNDDFAKADVEITQWITSTGTL